MAIKTQFNPSTLKEIFNPVTQKVQMAVAGGGPSCAYCTGAAPETITAVISGLADCSCLLLGSGYFKAPGVAAQLNGVHVLSRVEYSGYCRWEKQISVNQVIEYWERQVSPYIPCHEYLYDDYIYETLKITAMLLSNRTIRFEAAYPGVYGVYQPMLAFNGYSAVFGVGTPCVDMDCEVVNEENSCQDVYYTSLWSGTPDSYISACEGGIVNLTL